MLLFHWTPLPLPPLQIQSYYGEQKLHFLPSDPAKSDKACTVDLKDGPVHDVQVCGHSEM